MTAMRASVLTHFPAGTTVTDPAGGMVLWVSMPDEIRSRELYRLAMDRGIVIAPGPVFSLQNRFASQIRLNAGVWGPATDAKIGVLGELAGRGNSV